MGVAGRLTIGPNDIFIMDGGGASGSGDLILGARTIDNGGTIQWQPGAWRITLRAGGSFNNDGGEFDFYNPAGEMLIILRTP